jgi:hypothetical protein
MGKAAPVRGRPFLVERVERELEKDKHENSKGTDI